MANQLRGQIDELWPKRKADLLRGQIDDVRRSVDDLVKSSNRAMATGSEILADTQRRIGRQASEMVGETGEGGEGGFSWWIPIAILGAVGAAAWLYNMSKSGGTEDMRSQTPNFQAGFQPPRQSTESPFPEQR